MVGKKTADSASAVDQRKGAALGIGQWQQVREERERNVNERKKLSYFVRKARDVSRDGDGRIDLKQKEEEYILTRFFFYKIFSLREKWFLLIEIFIFNIWLFMA